MIGKKIHELATKLFPINRSLTGNGVRKTLSILKEICPTMTIHEVPSGTQVFDWTIPNEWNISDAYIIAPNGERIVDFKNNNLHVVGYSKPVNIELNLEELNKHLYSLPDQPNAIPYVTSYYKENWGFCLTDSQKRSLKPGNYKVVIDAKLEPGFLTYGEIIIPGETNEEIFLSTYVCHPSMANNELSGPCVAIHLAEWIHSIPKRKYTYRFVFIPETIGSITYLSKNLEHLKTFVKAGFNISCVGDDRSYSYLPSKKGNTVSDEVAKHVLKWTDKNFISYSWRERGSDERQYCAPGVDLPIASIMRTKYAKYPEYHTSLDDLNFVTPEGLEGGFNALKRALEVLEKNCYPQMTVLGEPQLGKRGLYPDLSIKNNTHLIRLMMDFTTYSDGTTTLLEIAERCDVPIWELYTLVEQLHQHGLIELKPR